MVFNRCRIDSAAYQVVYTNVVNLVKRYIMSDLNDFKLGGYHNAGGYIRDGTGRERTRPMSDVQAFVGASTAAVSEPFSWGVDWGNSGDRSCVTIAKKHADGRVEIVACEYSPPIAAVSELREELHHLSHRAGGDFTDDQLAQILRAFDLAASRL